MSDPVELSVRGSLQKVIDELGVIRDKAAETGEAFKETGKGVEDGLRNNTKRTETFFGNLRSISRRLADQMRGDFKSLLSVNALTDAMKLSNQFRQNVAETVQLSDAVRKLGTTFGIAGKNFASFQANLTKGLGELGLGSEVGVAALEGLSQTPVRGQANIIGYAQQAGMLASISRDQGKEGDIARSIARVIQARGGDVNDPQQAMALAESLRKVFVQTGQTPAQSLKAMEDIFRSMPEDMRKALTSNALTNLTAAGAVAGPDSVKFLEEYLSKSPIARMAFEAQGGKGIVTDKGIDINKFRTFAKDILGRVGGDPRLAAQTLGLSQEAAEGFVRLAENLDKVEDAQERVARTTGNINEQYRKSLGLGEAFKANLNRVKQSMAEPLSWASQKTTDLLGQASGSTAGSTAVVAGAGVAATLLAGMGLRGVGKGLGGIAGTVARKEGAEELLGAKTVPVYVVNASEIGGSFTDFLKGGAAAAGGTGAAAGGASLLGPIGLGILAAIGLDEIFDQGERDIMEATKPGADHTQQQYTEGQLKIMKKMLDAGKIPEGKRAQVEQILKDQDRGAWVPQHERDQSNGSWQPVLPSPAKDDPSKPSPSHDARPQKVIVELNPSQLKASVQPTRGATN